MKRKSKFLIGFATALLTFGTLMATLGPEKFNKYGHRHCGGHYYHMQHCDQSQQQTPQN